MRQKLKKKTFPCFLFYNTQSWNTHKLKIIESVDDCSKKQFNHMNKIIFLVIIIIATKMNVFIPQFRPLINQYNRFLQISIFSISFVLKDETLIDKK